ncbi:histidinol-phosphate aminotransferase, partial [human gut metagenome]
MIEGHGDDSYKYSRPITANFSSNVYSRVDLSALKAHLCTRIDGIGNYPEPEPYT